MAELHKTAPSARTKLFSLFFWTYLFFALMVFWFAVVIPWLLITPFDRRRVFAHWYAYTWANHLHRVSPFWTVVVEQAERMRDDQAYVLVCNHQSSADILAMFSLRKQFRWVSKRELFAVPFMGWMMAMAGYVGIKRGDKRSRARMMKKCHRQLELGNTIAIFPEGTRSKTMQMRPFKLGAFVLACEAKKPVLPVIMEGTRETLPRESWWFAVEQKVYPIVRVLDPVDPGAHGFDPQRVADAVQAKMAEGLAVLRAEIDARGGLETRPPGHRGN